MRALAPLTQASASTNVPCEGEFTLPAGVGAEAIICATPAPCCFIASSICFCTATSTLSSVGPTCLLMQDAGPVCRRCARLDHLVYLPAGDAKLSRRARQASQLCAVVVRFSPSRKRYERQGILVEEAALQQAEAQTRN